MNKYSRQQIYFEYCLIETPLNGQLSKKNSGMRIDWQRHSLSFLSLLLIFCTILVGGSLFWEIGESGWVSRSMEIQAAAVLLPVESAALVVVTEPVVELKPVINSKVVQSTRLSPIFAPEVLRWEEQIIRWAEAEQVDPNLVAIIMQIESCGDPQAISSAGAQGLFQVMPFHFASGEDSLDPETNAMRGVAFFALMLKQTNGDIGRAFAGYNGGNYAAQNSYDQWHPETQRYYYWSMGIYADLQQGLEQSSRLQEWLRAGGRSLCQQAANRLIHVN